MSAGPAFGRPSALRERFAPLLAEIRAGAVEREAERRHPVEEVARLQRAGLGALRLPVDRGGSGASLAELFELWIDLAAADSNIAQAYRQHLFWVELNRILLHLDPAAESPGFWVERIAEGDFFGNGTTEPPDSVIGSLATVLGRDADGEWRLNGRKIYSTGNLFAQWIPVSAVTEDGAAVVVTVPTDRAGVSRQDDWTGFGQRLTGSGTTVFEGVRVQEGEISPAGGEDDSRHGAGLHQLVLLATIAGIAQAAAVDVVELVGARRRVYATGSGSLPKDDPVIQEAVGRVIAAARTARAIVESAARSLEAAWSLWESDADPGVVSERFAAVEIEISAAQVSLIPLVLSATGEIFDALGASATHRALDLDRHWRNARVLASHNPHLYKARIVGANALTGELPPKFRAGSDVGLRRDP